MKVRSEPHRINVDPQVQPRSSRMNGVAGCSPNKHLVVFGDVPRARLEAHDELTVQIYYPPALNQRTARCQKNAEPIQVPQV